MKSLNRKSLSFIVTLLAIQEAIAQTPEVWYNPRLLAQGATIEEHNSVGRFDETQCFGEARIKISGMPQAQVDCSKFIQMYGNGIMATSSCRSEQERQNSARNQLTQDLARSCFAARGWVFGILPEKFRTPAPDKQSLPPSTGSTETPHEATSTGSGFFVTSTEYLITNEHVVRGCKRVTGQTTTKEETIVEVVATEPESDLALLKSISASAHAKFSSNNARLGESIVVFGYPLAGTLSPAGVVTTGSVSSLSGLGGASGSLQISSPIQPGNSGGAVLNSAGQVIGVVRSKLSAAKMLKVTGDIPQNINFAIKASVVIDFLDAQNIKYEKASSKSAQPTTRVAEEAKNFSILLTCYSSKS